MKANIILNNFVGGELSPRMAGRSELDAYKKGMAWCQNFIPLPQGPLSYRPGNLYCGLTAASGAAVLIPFQFSANDAIMIVATDSLFRFYRNDQPILNTAVVISGITNANPGVVTATAHGLTAGQEVQIDQVQGMPQVNKNFYVVFGVTANTFQLKDQFGNFVDTTSFGTYTSGGTVASIYTLATTYIAADLQYIRAAQVGDVMYLVCRNPFTNNAYDIRKLTRSGFTNWTIATFARISDPFTTMATWPGAVAFTSDGRLAYSSSQNFPQGWWASELPTGPTTNYDNFTTGGAAAFAAVFQFAPVNGEVDSIQEMVQFGGNFALLGSSSIVQIYGSQPGQPANPTAINSVPTMQGSAHVKPLVINWDLVFVDVDGKSLRGLQYNLAFSQYAAKDYNIDAEHFGAESQFTKMAYVKLPQVEMVWVMRADGSLLCLTFNNLENIAGWSRHYISGGNAKVIDIGVIRKVGGFDELWMIVQRTFNGTTYTSVEVMSNWPQIPLKRKFYSGNGNQAADSAAWSSAAWESLKTASYLDMSLTYDGTNRGTVAGATITLSGTTGLITATASAAVFQASDKGQQLWKSYNALGVGGGQATITGVVSPTQVTLNTIAPFNSTSAIPAGSWAIAVNKINNLGLFNGQTMDVQADGGKHPSQLVTANSITLQWFASSVQVGFGYVGLISSLNVDAGAKTGPASCKMRNITEVRVRLDNTLGGFIGASEYSLSELVLRKTNQIANRVPDPFTGVIKQGISDSSSFSYKNVVWMHKDPTPCTVVSFDVDLDTNDTA